MVTFSMPPEHSGAAKQAITLASQLAKKGARIFFVTPRSTQACPGTNTVAGFKVIRVSKVNWFWKALAPLRIFLVLFRERHSFSVIHVHGVGYLSNVAVLFGKIFRKHVLIKMTMFSEDDPMSLRRRRHGRVNFFFFSQASRVIAITDSFYQSCLSAGLPPSRICRLPNGVDTGRFKPVSSADRDALRTKHGLPRDKTILVYAGIIRPEKGIDFLLDAMACLGEKRRDIVLALIGPLETWLPSGERDFAAGQIRRAEGMKGLVHYLGKIDNVQELFQCADIFVSASMKEGFPNVLLEAMACGLPAVVTDIADVYSNVLVHRVDGLVVGGRDVRAFASHIEELVDNKDLQKALSRSALTKISNTFAIDKVASRYLDLLQDLSPPVLHPQ